MTVTENLVDAWQEARTRFSNQLPDVTESNLSLKLVHTKNTVGFLIRHIADEELLFAKNMFGEVGLQVQAKTVIAQRDTGEWLKLVTP